MKSLILLFTLLYLPRIDSQYIKLDSSNLPICIIDSRGKAIANEPKILAHMKIIDNGPGKMNYIKDPALNYNNFIAIEIRGNSSQSYPQKQYGVELRDSTTGLDIDTSLMGLPNEEDWVLYAPYNDISLLRNVLTYHLWNQMDHWGPRTKLCELILNNEYVGVYVLMESIKRGSNRVDISKLKPADTSGIELTGGYIVKIDKQNATTDKSFVSKVKSTNNQNITWLYHYPKAEDISSAQENYIHRYIDTVEQLIASANFADPINGYSKYLSLPSFIDYFILTEFSRNIDAYKASSYFYKEKRKADGSGGQFKAGPVWDYNFAFGNASFCTGGPTTGWMYDGCTPSTLPTPSLWRRLLADPNYLNEVRCRYNVLRKTILDTSYIFKFLNSYANDTLKFAQQRHFAKWKILGTNPGGFNAYIANSYPEEMTHLKSWIKDRLKWMDNNLQGTCSPTVLKIKAPVQIPCNNLNHSSISDNQPFNVSPFNYSGMERFQNNNSDIVRWVLLELRSSKDSTKIIARRAALLKNDSTVVDTNFSSNIIFPNATPYDNYFVAIRYDEQTVLISKIAIKIPNISSLNFTQSSIIQVPQIYSPIVYDSHWLGFDTLKMCKGSSIILNDSNLIKSGYVNLTRSYVSNGIVINELNEHLFEVMGKKDGLFKLTIIHLCAASHYIRSELTIIILPSPEVHIDGSNYVCEDTSVVWSARGYKLLWSNGSTKDSIKISVPGQYYVTVTDALGCSASTEKILSKTPSIQGSIEHIENWSSTECKLFFLPNGNYGPFKFLWGDGSTLDTLITNLSRITLTVSDSFGCRKEFQKDCSPLSVDDSSQQQFFVYPNPSEGQLFVEGNGINRIRILCISRMVGEYHLVPGNSSELKITFYNLPPGLYAVVIETKDNMKWYKVIVAR